MHKVSIQTASDFSFELKAYFEVHLATADFESWSTNHRCFETSPATTQASDSDTTKLRQRPASRCRIKLKLGRVLEDFDHDRFCSAVISFA
jgi:hypothetical protein